MKIQIINLILSIVLVSTFTLKIVIKLDKAYKANKSNKANNKDNFLQLQNNKHHLSIIKTIKSFTKTNMIKLNANAMI